MAEVRQCTKFISREAVMNITDLRRVDLNLLVVFETLISERHVGRTARRLGVSQSAVSHALGRLRKLFGDPLFIRHPKGIEPTMRCTVLASRVTDVLNRARGVLESNAPFDPKRPHRFNIGLTDGSIAILVALLERLRRTAPQAELHVTSVDAAATLAALDHQEVDCALLLMPQRKLPARVVRTALLDMHYVCLARRDNDKVLKSALSPAEFAALPHLAISPRGDPGTVVDSLLGEAGLRRNIVLTISHFLAGPLIAAHTDLVAIVDQSIARLYEADKNLVRFELPVKLRPVTTDLVTAAARADEPALKWLRHECLVACRGIAPTR